MTVDQLKHYQRVLESRGYSVEMQEPDSLHLQLEIAGKLLHMICTFPPFYPYQFPKIRLTEDSWKLCGIMPHRYVTGDICLFNSADARPNFTAPDALLLASLEKAKKILADGLCQSNTDDFEKEILQYWGKDSTIECRSFIDFSKVPCTFLVNCVEESKDEKYFLLSRDEGHLKSISQNLFSVNIQESQYGLYIPLTTSFKSYEVHTEKDIWAMISSGTDVKVKKFIDDQMKILHNKILLIVVSIPAEKNDLVCLGWINSSCLNAHEYVSPFEYWPLQKASELSNIIKVRITHCSQKYLFYRGSYGFNRRIQSAAIIGCGSVGSQLAMQLISMGTEKFMLFDNENLEANNIARHTCGYWLIGWRKVNAVALRMRSMNPNITCSPIFGNILSTIQNHLEEINKLSCIFLAVGDMPVEAYILKMAKEGAINVPIILTWVEPRCYACHMVYISKPHNAFDKLVNPETLTYRDTVILENSFIEHVPGCQTGFIPYSGLDVQQFLSRCLHQLTNIISNPSLNGNYHMIWIGELSEGRRQKIKIDDAYRTSSDFSLVLKRFD